MPRRPRVPPVELRTWPLNAEEVIALLAARAGRPEDDARGIARELGLSGGLRRALED